MVFGLQPRTPEPGRWIVNVDTISALELPRLAGNLPLLTSVYDSGICSLCLIPCGKFYSGAKGVIT